MDSSLLHPHTISCQTDTDLINSIYKPNIWRSVTAQHTSIMLLFLLQFLSCLLGTSQAVSRLTVIFQVLGCRHLGTSNFLQGFWVFKFRYSYLAKSTLTHSLHRRKSRIFKSKGHLQEFCLNRELYHNFQCSQRSNCGRRLPMILCFLHLASSLVVTAFSKTKLTWGILISLLQNHCALSFSYLECLSIGNTQLCKNIPHFLMYLYISRNHWLCDIGNPGNFFTSNYKWFHKGMEMNSCRSGACL